jgi:hypothetical protein
MNALGRADWLLMRLRRDLAQVADLIDIAEFFCSISIWHEACKANGR